MPRNPEVIRQWTILKEIESARARGVTIDELAGVCQVTTRTIRRDLEALEQAGFPIYNDRSDDDNRTRWLLNGQAFKGLAAGLTLAELCALHFSRTLLEALAGTPFQTDVASAFEKLTTGLTPHMRQFVDRLPRVIAAKPEPARRLGGALQPTLVARALQATLDQRQATLTYASKASRRTKSYLVHPYRLAYAQGGLYLLAYVPEYAEVRTFALERLLDIHLLDERFLQIEALPDAAFPHSIGVHSGPPEHVALRFDASAADYVRSREWHPSQTVTEDADDALLVGLDVCLDEALYSWILSFGGSVMVVAPESLRHLVASRLHDAAAQYGERE